MVNVSEKTWTGSWEKGEKGNGSPLFQESFLESPKLAFSSLEELNSSALHISGPILKCILMYKNSLIHSTNIYWIPLFIEPQTLCWVWGEAEGTQGISSLFIPFYIERDKARGSRLPRRTDRSGLGSSVTGMKCILRPSRFDLLLPLQPSLISPGIRPFL